VKNFFITPFSNWYPRFLTHKNISANWQMQKKLATQLPMIVKNDGFIEERYEII
jgi:hypothetical protein